MSFPPSAAPAMTAESEVAIAQAARRQRLAILARADRALLQAAWDGLADRPGFRHLKQPETGLAMIRARAGGNGQRFNFGEMTVTRCVVALDGDSPAMGVGYVQGRDRRKAELVALFDALAQDPARRPAIDAAVIQPTEAALAERRARRAGKVAATKVDFFTLVRGED